MKNWDMPSGFPLTMKRRWNRDLKVCAAFLTDTCPALSARHLALIQGRKLEQRATAASSLLIA
jgi:hypothetical protein